MLLKIIDIYYYDVNYTYLNYHVSPHVSFEFTVPENCKYIRFVEQSKATYNNNICIRLVHSGYKTDYVPHEEDTLSMNILEYFPNGLCGIGNVRDSFSKNGAIQRIGVVDLGSLNYTVGSTFIYAKAPSDMALDAAGVCYKYITHNASLNDKIIALRPDKQGEFMKGYIGIRDSSYTDASTFKAAMSGVKLYYELATPIVTTITSSPTLSYKVWDFGTEELLTNSMSAPMRVKTIYGFNATDTIRGNKFKNNEQDERLSDIEATMVQKDDYAPKLTVGYADNLLSSDVTIDSDFHIRRTGDGVISDGVARFEEIRGNSIVWNQLSTMEKDVEITIDADHSKSYRTPLNQTVTLNNKCLVSLECKKDENFTDSVWILLSQGGNMWGSTYNFTSELTTSYKKIERIITSNNENNSHVTVYAYNGVSAGSITFKNVKCYNLTKMFGAGNEPSAVEEFYKRIPQNVDLNAYNPGEIIDMNVDAVKSVGRNIWDEEWELGTIISGETTDVNLDRFRSKNYIRVNPGVKYYVTTPVYLYVHCYDSNKNWVSTHVPNGIVATDKTILKLGDNVSYIKFRTLSGTTYNNDICINISDSDFNGQYMPYQYNIKSLPSVIKQHFPDGMKSVKTVCDRIYNKDGKGIVEKRIETITFDSCSSVQSVNDYGIVNIALISSNKIYGTRAISHKYSEQSSLIADTENEGWYVSFGLGSSVMNALYLRLKSSTIGGTTYSAANAYLAQNPITFNIELAEPIITVYDEPFNLVYDVTNGGQEEVISTKPTSNLRASISYGFNAAGKIKENTLAINELRSSVLTDEELDKLFNS